MTTPAERDLPPLPSPDLWLDATSTMRGYKQRPSPGPWFDVDSMHAYARAALASSPALTQEAFIAGYCKRSEMSMETYDSNFVALPCNCEDESCTGWATIRRKPENILEHVGSDLGAAYFNLTSPAVQAVPSPAPSLTTYLENIYAFLCSVAPEGLADEAFRDIPEAVFGDSARSRIASQESPQCPNAGAVSGFSRPDRGTGKETRDAVGAAALAAPVAQPEPRSMDEHPRCILWDSNHPDYPVEWTNPGRAARDGEVAYIRYDLFSEAMNAAAPSQPEPTVGERA